MRTSRLALLLVIALVAGGCLGRCGGSEVADDAEVVVAGRLLRADGSPAGGIPVGLIKRPGVLEVLGGIAGSIASLGLLCLVEAVSLCKAARKATTGADGTYRFTLRGEETKGDLGTPGTFTLSAVLPAADGKAAGASLQSMFDLDRADFAVPDLTFWEPADLTVTPGPRRIGVRWPAFTSPGRKPQYAVMVTAEDDTLVWSQEARSGDSLDARAVGDVEGALHVTASVTQKAHGVTFRTTYGSPRLALRGLAGPPPSRGRDCSVAGGSGAVTLTPCPLTDGAYDKSFPDQFCDTSAGSSASPNSCEAGSWLAVNLGGESGERGRAGTLFAYDLDLFGELAVETSDDGATWTRRKMVKPVQFLRLTLPDIGQSRYVRLASTDPRRPISRLTELAIWPD